MLVVHIVMLANLYHLNTLKLNIATLYEPSSTQNDNKRRDALNARKQNESFIAVSKKTKKKPKKLGILEIEPK